MDKTRPPDDGPDPPAHLIADLEARVAELERSIAADRGEPYRCPLCEGAGSVWSPLSTAPLPCHACHGARVLWSRA